MTLSDAREEARNDAAREAEFRRDCRAAAAEIRNDLQALMLLTEDIARKWAEHGWLNRTKQDAKFDADQREWVSRAVLVSPDIAVSDLAIVIKQDMEDALSLTAQEALEVAS